MTYKYSTYGSWKKIPEDFINSCQTSTSNNFWEIRRQLQETRATFYKQWQSQKRH